MTDDPAAWRRKVLDAYAAASGDLSGHLESLDTAEILSPVAGYLPDEPGRVLDIGAGTGRDAAWFARRGHHVCAAEPVAPLRRAGRALRGTAAIDWLEDGLPDLPELARRGSLFDLVLVNAVWHHVPPEYRPSAMTALAARVAAGGRLIMSLRDGPADPARPAFPADADGTVARAQDEGLRLLWRGWVPAVQPGNSVSGVTFTWLVLARD